MLSQAADMIVAGAAIVALVFTWFELRSHRKNSQEEYARQVWTEFTKSAIEHPHLTSTEMAMRYPSPTSLEDLAEGRTEHAKRYLWFVTLLLDSCEAIVSRPPMKWWKKTGESNLNSHSKILAQKWRTKANWSQFYGPDLNLIVDRILHDQQDPQGPSVPS